MSVYAKWDICSLVVLNAFFCLDTYYVLSAKEQREYENQSFVLERKWIAETAK